MSKFIYIFILFLLSTTSFANDAWNNAKSQEIRNKIAQNANYGADSGRITVHNYDRTKAMVESSMKASASVDGSKASVTAKVKTPVNIAKVASTTMKRLARGGVAGMIGGAAVQALVDGVGWVIEDNQIKKPTSDKPKQYWTWIPPWDTSFQPGYGQDSRCNGINSTYTQAKDNVTYCLKTFRKAQEVTCSTTSSTVSSCNATFSGSITTFGIFFIKDPKGEDPKLVPVSDTELAEKLNEKNDSNTDTIVKSAYTPADNSGKASPNLNDLLNGLNDTIKDIVNDFNDIIKSDNPTTTGKTDSTPTITFNNTTINNDNTTVVNEDGTITTTGTSNFELPAWCDWAFDMCTWHKEDNQHQQEETTFWDDVRNFFTDIKNWFDWTKDDSDLPERDDSDLDADEPLEEKTYSINWSASCPAKETVTASLHGVSALIPVADFSYLCSLDWLIKPFVIGFASISACFILFGFNRGGDDG